MDYDEMEANHETDMLVAERVMRWKWMSRIDDSSNSNPYRSAWLFPLDSEDVDTGRIDSFGEPIITRGPSGIVGPFREYDGGRKESTYVPRYSANIEAAWQVVEKLRDGLRFELRRRPDGGYWVSFGEEMTAEADTAPLAICRAALRAADHKDGEEAGE